MIHSIRLALATTLVLGQALLPAQKPGKPPPQPLVFQLEEKFGRSVPLPQDVFQQLARYKRTQSCLQGDHENDKVQPSWFVAAEVDLDGAGAPELIVRAENACLWGANTGPFWIFQKTPHGYRSLLEVEAVSIEIKRARTRGYLDIQAWTHSAVNVYTTRLKFDGKKYIPAWRRTERNR